ncbi:TlpA family protein disulfide reductase [Flavobacterium sp.]|jgi:thiol-disulfide isomerase/thioredoxin|uniref:TlpA family protein disulfide reductase n=1 Tax=Flavobacterium sp. TaxID=239 RepID=UPI0037C13692
MKKIVYFLCIVQSTFAQTSNKIEGTFANAKEKEIRLMGFWGTKDTLFSQTKTDASGNFILSYPKKYIGAATIQVKEITNLIVLLNNENFNINWSDFKDFDRVQFKNTKDNEWFQKAYAINLEVIKRLAGINYLLPLYKMDSTKTGWATNLEKEIIFENTRFQEYQKQLPNNSYVKEYLKYRTLLQKLKQEKKTKEEQLETSSTFLAIDFSNLNLFNSGLAKDLFEEYLKQILNLQNKEEIINKLNAFSEIIKKSANSNSLCLNEYTEFLIKHFEQYGLTEAAEKLALSLLNDNKCVIDNQRLPLLEQYKKMAIGKTAPNLVFSNHSKYKSLTDLNSKYKIIVFGASWCEECKKEIPQFKEYAETFKTKYDAEIIFISIDTDKDKYHEFVKNVPFINSCDFKGWESPNVKNYFIFATPTVYVLDQQNKIVSKPLNAIDTAKWLFEKIKH